MTYWVHISQQEASSSFQFSVTVNRQHDPQGARSTAIYRSTPNRPFQKVLSFLQKSPLEFQLPKRVARDNVPISTLHNKGAYLIIRITNSTEKLDIFDEVEGPVVASKKPWLVSSADASCWDCWDCWDCWGCWYSDSFNEQALLKFGRKAKDLRGCEEGRFFFPFSSNKCALVLNNGTAAAKCMGWTLLLISCRRLEITYRSSL